MRVVQPSVSKPRSWKLEYGYRRTIGWRKKILCRAKWDYPRMGMELPFRAVFHVHVRQTWSALLFVRSLGAKMIEVGHGRSANIVVEIPASLSVERLGRFVERCHRSSLVKQRLGLHALQFLRLAQRPAATR